MNQPDKEEIGQTVEETLPVPEEEEPITPDQ